MKRVPLILLLLIISVLKLNAQLFGDTKIEIPTVNIFIEVIPAEIKQNEKLRIYATYKIPENYHMFLNKELFNIYINDPSDLIAIETVYPMDEAEDLLGTPAFSGSVRIFRDFIIPDDMAEGDYELNIQAAYQICEDDGTCLLPDTEQFTRKITVNVSNRTADTTPNILIILQYILMAFIGGLLLNIMPCVLPLLSVKALNLLEQSNHDKKTIFKSSLLYGLGILISFLALAFIVIILKGSGELFGWGFQFQNPLFVLILISVIFIFSLSLFDIFTINAPQKSMNKATSFSTGKSYSGSLFTGIFAVLVATPCTAPFMGAALGFAFSQPPFIILLIFTSLSIGFALPFILLGIFPQLIKKLPKPGKWMNTFKEFMGFLLLGTVVYLLTSLHSLIGSSIKGILWFLLFTGLAVWVFGRFGSIVEKKSKRIIAILIALFIISLSAILFVDLNPVTSTNIESDSRFEKFSTELVEKYRLENEIVFIDFYADWCTSCKINDAAVLNTKKIKTLFEKYNVHFLKGDFTAGDKEIALWLSQYNRAGVPLYILFRPGEDAVIFPEILTQAMIEKEILQITSN